ncbi:MAG TPA: hypothetical protein DCR27_06550, partial [Lachnospiraceae bacterium]|nr:hypothetical protein [Lachnospiraceae bacterium]
MNKELFGFFSGILFANLPKKWYEKQKFCIQSRVEEVDMKILIYGLGKEALLVKSTLKKEHIIVGFTDSIAKIKNYAGLHFYNRKELKKTDFDCIIIALGNRNVSDCIKDELVQEGIGAERIIDFRQLFARQKVDKVMYKSKNERVDGIILGLSHALHGVNPTYLFGVWKNLATASEDLYYHYKVLKRCADYYPFVISDLQYAIIDMYDYTVFNYDVSRSKGILEYWSWGGYAEDIHHFKENKNYSETSMEEMKRAGFYFPVIDDKDFRFADQLFDMNKIFEIDWFRDYPPQLELDKVISEEPLLPYNLFYMGEERYPETIEENKCILEEMIRLLKKINPKIKIYFILFPRFGIVEKYHKH